MKQPTPTPRPLRGPDLRAERVRKGLRQIDIAEALGYTRAAISNIERAYRPPAGVARRYLDVVEAAPE